MKHSQPNRLSGITAYNMQHIILTHLQHRVITGLLKKLQCVQNDATRFVTIKGRKFDHISPLYFKNSVGCSFSRIAFKVFTSVSRNRTLAYPITVCQHHQLLKAIVGLDCVCQELRVSVIPKPLWCIEEHSVHPVQRFGMRCPSNSVFQKL